MKTKLFVILILISLLVASSGTASAQGSSSLRRSDNLPARPGNSFWFSDARGYGEVVIKTSKTDAPEISENPVSTLVESSLLATTPIVNGNFEQGQFVGWTESSSNGWDVVVSSGPVTPHSGSWIAWLGDDDFEVTTLTQSGISITSPTFLRLWYWIGSGDDCGFDYGYVKVNSSIIHIWDLCYSTNTYGWVPLDINLNAYNGQTVTLTIEVTTDESWASGLLIDDVSLYGTFADVPYGYGFWSYIEGLYDAGVTSGCSVTPSLFCPTTTVTRDQMAVFLLTAKHGAGYVPPDATGEFGDVPTTHWAAKWIEQLAAEGITSGCGGGNYCPNLPVTRDQMAVFLLTAKHGAGYVPPDATGEFGDVPVDYWAAKWIEQLAAEGITGGCSASPMLYCPTTPVSRDQMAVFLVSTFNLPIP